ncbi:hypothetical protein HMN09_01417400 [Mycena chlorophos]|uniref:F-box domain-containing protein n=1 Tax=Mycena chlorophos TaxID=658473 RepID=A0A8H6RX32_MYCCL|nr:hypothetical protein HMN09_01417400 [Mycena chlorophos]
MARRKRVNPTPLPVQNTAGLALLPAELLLEIVSWLHPSAPVAHRAHIDALDSRAAELTSIQAFCALSRTSRRLRQFFLPYAWQQIVVYAPNNGGPLSRPLAQRLATELIEKLETVVIRNKALAAHVSSMDVTIGDYCEDKVLREFMRSLSCLSNLTSLCVSTTPRRDYVGTRSKDPFEAASAYKFPSIRRLTVAHVAITLAWSCPNLRKLTISSSVLPQSDTFGSLSFASLAPLAKSTPHLRSLFCVSISLQTESRTRANKFPALPPALEEFGLITIGRAGVDPTLLKRITDHPSMRRIHFRKDSASEWLAPGRIDTEAAVLRKAGRYVQENMMMKPGVDAADVYVTLRPASDRGTSQSKLYEFDSGGKDWVRVEQLKEFEH